MRTITSFLILLIVSCSNNKKKDTLNVNEPKTIEKKVELNNSDKQNKLDNIPVVENLLEDPNVYNISHQPHKFDDKIVFTEVNVIKVKENVYTFIYVLDDEVTNVEMLKNWKLGVYFFARDFENFKKKTDQDRKYRTYGFLIKPVIMGNELVFSTKNFEIGPKQFSQIRSYLYNDTGVLNKSYYNIPDVILP